MKRLYKIAIFIMDFFEVFGFFLAPILFGYWIGVKCLPCIILSGVLTGVLIIMIFRIKRDVDKEDEEQKSKDSKEESDGISNE